jgi:GntR family transcriptional regulator, carbon starvation induced regulator
MEPAIEESEGGAATRASSVSLRLRTLITTGQIRPGERLRLDELRARFGVSLSPLREALSRLATEGFVVMEEQRGYRVAPISDGNLREVTRLRAELETLALREAIRLGDDAWEAEIVASLYRLNKLERAPSTRAPAAAPRTASAHVPTLGRAASAHVPEWEIAHRIFHRQLLSACAMPLLMQFCTTLHDLNDRYRRLFLERNPIDRNVSDEHAAIADATLARDAELACRRLRQHIERTGANVLRALNEQAQGAPRQRRRARR